MRGTKLIDSARRGEVFDKLPNEDIEPSTSAPARVPRRARVASLALAANAASIAAMRAATRCEKLTVRCPGVQGGSGCGVASGDCRCCEFEFEAADVNWAGSGGGAFPSFVSARGRFVITLD